MALFRYEVDNPDIKETMNRIGGVIGEALPDGWGFTLLLFEYGPAGSLFYISSAERASVLQTMREFLEKAGEN